MSCRDLFSAAIVQWSLTCPGSLFLQFRHKQQHIFITFIISILAQPTGNVADVSTRMVTSGNREIFN